MYEQFKFSENGLDLECHNYFQEIRNQRDMQREKIKEKVDDIYMDMIEMTKKFEASYLKSVNEKLETPLKSEETTKSKIVDELKETGEEFRNPNILIESIKEFHQKQQMIIKNNKFNLNKMNRII